MKPFFTRLMTWVVLVSFSHTYVICPALAAPPDSTLDHPSSSLSHPRFPQNEFPLPSDAVTLSVTDPALLELLARYEETLRKDTSMPSLTHWVEARQEETWGQGRRFLLRAGAVVGALFSAFSIAELFIFNGGVMGLVGIYTTIPPIPPRLWLIGIGAGMAVLPDTYSSVQEALSFLTHRISPSSEEKIEEDRPKAPGHPLSYKAGMLALITGLVGKNLFAYIKLNLTDTPPWLAFLLSVGGLFYFGTQIDETRETFKTLWRNRPGQDVSADQQALQEGLAATFRKLTHDPETAKALNAELSAIEQARKDTETRVKHWFDQLSVSEQTAKQTEFERKSAEARRLSDLMKLEALTTFGLRTGSDEARYATPKVVKTPPTTWRGKIKRALFGEDQPWGGTAAKIAGMALSSFSYGAAYYSFWYIFSTMGLPVWATWAAVPAALGLGSYLLHAAGNQVRKLYRGFMGETPINQDDSVGTYQMGNSGLRAGFEFVDWGRRTFLMLAGSLVAGEGMYQARISVRIGQCMLGIYCISYGASTGGGGTQDWFNWIGKYFWGEEERERQEIAEELRTLSAWLQDLPPAQVTALHDALKNLRTTTEKMGKDKDEAALAARMALLAPRIAPFFSALSTTPDQETFDAILSQMNEAVTTLTENLSTVDLAGLETQTTQLRKAVAQQREQEMADTASHTGSASTPDEDDDDDDIFYDAEDFFNAALERVALDSPATSSVDSPPILRAAASLDSGNLTASPGVSASPSSASSSGSEGGSPSAPSASKPLSDALRTQTLTAVRLALQGKRLRPAEAPRAEHDDDDDDAQPDSLFQNIPLETLSRPQHAPANTNVPHAANSNDPLSALQEASRAYHEQAAAQLRANLPAGFALRTAVAAARQPTPDLSDENLLPDEETSLPEEAPPQSSRRKWVNFAVTGYGALSQPLLAGTYVEEDTLPLHPTAALRPQRWTDFWRKLLFGSATPPETSLDSPI